MITEVHAPPEDPVEDALPRPCQDLASAIASRICHDVVSPLGAIANGVELLLLSGAERTPEIDLIADSVEGASARIRFFRLAFGAPGGKAIGRKEILSILRGIEKNSRLVFDWSSPGDHPREQVKAIFLLLQCLETALPIGGRIRVAESGGTWIVEAEGPRLRIDPLVWDSLGPALASPPGTAALVQFALLPTLLDALGKKLTLSLGPERIVASF